MELASFLAARRSGINFEGTLFITDYRPLSGGIGGEAVVTLEDHTGASLALCTADTDLDGWQRRQGPVWISTRPRRLGCAVINEVVTMRTAEPDEIQNAARLLPRRYTPARAHAALQWLVDFGEQLPEGVMQSFFSRVLMDPAIGLGLITARSSFRHHHAERGGLLVHTVEVMQLVGHLAALKLRHQPHRVLQCQLAALLHDLGKVRTHPASGEAPKPWRPHEEVTVELLERHLVWLRREDEELASELDAALTLHQTPAWQRKRNGSVVAELTCLADQVSAMNLFEGSRKALYAPPAANDASASAHCAAEGRYFSR